MFDFFAGAKNWISDGLNATGKAPFANPSGAARFAREEAADGLWSGIGKGIGKAVKSPVGKAALIAGLAPLGILGVGLIGVSLLDDIAVLGVGKLLLNKLGGGKGALAGAGRLAGGLLKSGVETAGAAETIGRTLFTGRTHGLHSPQAILDAWMPFYRNLPSDNLKKYALNPRVFKTMTGMALAGGVLKSGYEAGKSLASPQIAPPTLYFDGTEMRHVDDMGVNSKYARSVLGRNSRL